MTRAEHLTNTPPAPSPVSSCDVTETLFADFGATLALPVIAAVVRQTRLDLDTTGPGTGADLETTARARLTALAADTTDPI